MFRATVIVASVLLVIGAAGQAYGAVVTFGTGLAFGGTAPEGARPWFTVTFDDGGSSGTVELTVSGGNLTGNEFISELYLNLDPAMDATSLVFSTPPGKTGSFDDPTIALGENAFKADGDGKHDILLTFATEDGLVTRFTSGDVLSYTVSGITLLEASSFDFISAPNGGEGEYVMAAHIQAIGQTSDSGWVTVPEPGCLVMLAIGAAAILRRRRG